MNSRRAFLLLIFGLIAALAAACGGGGSETAQSEQAVAAVEGVGQAEEDQYASPADGRDEVRLDEEQASEAAQPGGEGDLFVSAGVFESGPRAGGRFNRTMLGDPDAPVVITDYADFL